ncbi:hypothetical protein [Neisseria animalis]|uniref:hypothetical protein n=1 Tax=Neisseria animalis TaxID=492 RepID=UPI000F505064|nr:hypothetical protein [Neisseria animalis]
MEILNKELSTAQGTQRKETANKPTACPYNKNRRVKPSGFILLQVKRAQKESFKILSSPAKVVFSKVFFRNKRKTP